MSRSGGVVQSGVIRNQTSADCTCFTQTNSKTCRDVAFMPSLDSNPTDWTHMTMCVRVVKLNATQFISDSATPVLS